MKELKRQKRQFTHWIFLKTKRSIFDKLGKNYADVMKPLSAMPMTTSSFYFGHSTSLNPSAWKEL
jgi:hypothetical protein